MHRKNLPSIKTSPSWDIAGICVSVLCIVHCIALPFIVLFLPALATAFIPQEDWVHNILFLIIIFVASFAFIPGYKLHRQLKPILFLLLGVSILLFATFFAHDFSHHYEPVLAIIGSSAIILAHYLNHRSCKHKCKDHQHRKL